MSSIFSQLSHLKMLPPSTPLASIYVKLFGQEVAFANIDKAFINQLVLHKPQPQSQLHTIKLLLQGKNENNMFYPTDCH